MSKIEDLIEDIEHALKFYRDGMHYTWEGCSCHGSYRITDEGEEAEEGMEALEKLKEELKMT